MIGFCKVGLQSDMKHPWALTIASQTKSIVQRAVVAVWVDHIEALLNEKAQGAKSQLIPQGNSHLGLCLLWFSILSCFRGNRICGSLDTTMQIAMHKRDIFGIMGVVFL